MSLRSFRALTLNFGQSWIHGRTFFFVLALGWMVPLLAALFLWSAAATGPTGAGLNRDEIVVYYLALLLVNQITYSQTHLTVGNNIRSGHLAVWLLRPIPAVTHAFAAEIASKTIYLLFVVPAVGILALILRPDFSLRWPNLCAFAAALAGGWLLRFFWGYGLALVAFWTTRADGLLALQDAAAFLLGGQVAPIALLPLWAGHAAHALPFWYMIGFPVEALTGKVTGRELAWAFAAQAAWLAVALGLSWHLWKRGVRRYADAEG